MKKVLVITLVLVMAFASSAMAAVNFSGKFTATAEMDSFKVFSEEYKLTPGFTFTIGASNKDAFTVPVETEVEVAVLDEDGEETGEFITEIVTEYETVTNWDFSGGISLNADTSKFELGKYKLGLYDNYFNAWAWGNGQELTDKGTHFDLIKAGKAAPAAAMRARLEVPVLDVATVTVDLTAPTAVRAFVDAEVEGFNVGVAYLRDWAGADAVNVIAADVDTAIPAGDLTVNLKAAAGVKLGTDLGFALGLGADSMVTDELKLEGSVTHGSEHWAADAVTAKNTALTAKATFTEDAFQVIGDVGYTIVKDGTNTNSVALTGKYRMSEAVTFANLFNTKDNAWAANTAPAFGAVVKLAGMKFSNVTVDVTSPVMEDMIWVKGQAVYNADKKWEASVLGHIVPFDKLTIQPLVKYAHDGTDGTPTVNLKADYKIGASDTLLKFEGERVFATAPTSLLKLSVEVPF